MTASLEVVQELRKAIQPFIDGRFILTSYEQSAVHYLNGVLERQEKAELIPENLSILVRRVRQSLRSIVKNNFEHMAPNEVVLWAATDFAAENVEDELDKLARLDELDAMIAPLQDGCGRA